MFKTIQLIKHSINKETSKVQIFPNHKIFYSQKWQIPFSFKKNSYVSPYFSHPAFKIIFKIVFDDKQNAKIYIKLTDQTTFDSMKIYFLFGDPEGPNVSLHKNATFKLAERCHVFEIKGLSKSEILEDQDWLDDYCNLNVYFEICYYVRAQLMCSPQTQPRENSRSTTGNPGLSPVNNFCYMNSSLQILYHIPRIRTILYSCDNSNDKKVLLNTQSLFYNMERSHTQCSAEDLHNSIPFCLENAGKHKDASEFILELNSSLEKEIKGTNQRKQLDELFKIYLRSNFDLGSQNIKSQTEQMNSLDIYFHFNNQKEKDQLHQLCNYINKIEEKEEVPYNTGENGQNTAIKWCEFDSFPPILQIDLKRFEIDKRTNIMKKIETPVEFPYILNLGTYQYDLYAILAHGGDLNGGHYVSYVRNFPTENWYKYNDSIVTAIDLHNAIKTDSINKTAYLLFYVRRNDESNLFEKSEIPQQLKQILDQYEAKKQLEIKNKDLLTFSFILEEQLNERKSIDETIAKSQKKLRIKNSKTKFELYKEVANLFNKKSTEIRLWTADYKNIVGSLIDKSPYSNINGLKNNSVIFVQNKKEEDSLVPDIESDDLNNINYIMVFIKYFDTRMELPIRYIGPIIVDENSKLDTPKISQLLGFPEWTKYHYFREINQLAVKQIPANNTFKTAGIINGSSLIVQVDTKSTEESSKQETEIDTENNALADLSKSATFNGVKLISTTSQPVAEIKKDNKKLISNFNALDYLPNFDSKLLNNYLALKFNMKHFVMYDYQKQKSPAFTIDIPASVELKDLIQVIKKINDFEKDSIWLFDKKKDSDSASYDFITDARYITTIYGKSFPDDRLYFLYWPEIKSFDNKQIYIIQIASDGYNAFYKKAIVGRKRTTPLDLLLTASRKFKDFPNQVLSFCKEFDNIKRTTSNNDKTKAVSTRLRKRDKIVLKGGKIDRTSSQSSKDPPRCYEVNDFNIHQTFIMNDKINLYYRTIRFATFIPPEDDEVTVQVFQVKVDYNRMFKFVNEPFYMNVKQRSTVKMFKEKVEENVDVDFNALQKAKLEIIHNNTNNQTNGNYLINDDDEITDLTRNTSIFIIY